MSKRRTERLLSIVVLLRSTRRYLTADEIRSAVLGYPEADESFKRMFERDKEELRELGVPLETGLITPLDDEVGYRISKQDYELEIQLKADEAAMLGIAARVWEGAEFERTTTGALQKLRAGSEDDEDDDGGGDDRQAYRHGNGHGDASGGFPVIEPRLHTPAAFGALWEAVRDRRLVTFSYQTLGSADTLKRTLEPWGVVSRGSRWYVVGHDRLRNATRVFRLSRITGPVKLAGPRDGITVPDGVNVRELVLGWRQEDGKRKDAVIRVRVGTGHTLRRREDARISSDGPEWDIIRVSYPLDEPWYFGYLASFGPDVAVLEPPELRDSLIRRLKGALASNSEPVSWEPPPVDWARDAGAPSPAARVEPRMVTSSARLSRLLALVPYVQTRQTVSAEKAARAFGVDEDELRADVSLAWCVELKSPDPYCPIDLSYEGGEITAIETEAIGRPLRLTGDEASALLTALHVLEGLATGEDEALILARTTAKLEAAIDGSAAAVSQRLAVDVRKLEGDVRTYAADIRTALAQGRRVHLSYYVPGRDERTERDVDPVRLRLQDAHTYLKGWCYRAGDVRWFRLDRIVGLSVLDVPASVPAETEPADDADQGLFRPSERDVSVGLELSRQARWIPENYPCYWAEEAAEGRLRVALRTPDTQWVRRLALRLGDAAQVAAPGALADEVRLAASAALALYDEPEAASLIPPG
jgi:proteasome accessory factor B/proteasome accessory factor C